MNIPTSLNDSKKPSRSFYEQEDDLNLSPIVEAPKESTIKSTKQSEPESTNELKSTFIDGYKINTSNFLEKHFNSIRKSIITQFDIANAELNNITAASRNEINNLYSNLVSVYDPKDEFIPGFIYTLTSTLTGSILVHNRGLTLRFLSPLLLASLGFKFFLPGTFNNTLNVVKNWEAEFHPDLLQSQRNLKKFLIDSENQLEDFGKNANQSLISTIHDIRTSLTK
ncbi:hypothetical protein BN7_1398 [Wickerhamomyces ciferrii]|uniref:MICOS complex subunit n=1 Tax=Wickerhamomyces ciferrii (strain ATCC 14091 / BCRC 22168 / CBS 111 / JCM 3599 / NBRC 0793 / NRRL Y-1031 F-60-10) TaxID=1206466 RepID=K0KK68_WICCF|nr:uncharacterized protein BN7_1398 [Wickerhamomyces ciferrii]CCH41859.1 hypothetical protein BN7_1398 [Wickerhamomyces ciferrii]